MGDVLTLLGEACKESKGAASKESLPYRLVSVYKANPLLLVAVDQTTVSEMMESGVLATTSAL